MSIQDLYYEPNRYVAFVLDDKSRDTLLKVCPPTFSKAVCHHITIIFNPTEKAFDEFKKQFEKSDPVVKATAILIGKHIEAIAVEIDKHIKRADGNYYHITQSLEPPATPKDSNDLFDNQEIKKIHFHKPITLTGEFQLCKRTNAK